MTMVQEKYTPTHKRILAMLSDGLSHTKEELQTCLYDELSDARTVINHITYLRRLLPPGQDIVSRYRPDGSRAYTHVRIVSIRDE